MKILLTRLLFVILLGLSSAGIGNTANARPELDKVRIAVGGKASLYYLPLTIAEQFGYFHDEGVDVEISDFAGGAKALQSAVGGSADVVSGAFESVIQIGAKGLRFRAFVLQGIAPQITLGIASRKARNFTSNKDLKGFKIGVSAPGSSTNVLVNYVLAHAGLKPDDVAIIGVGTSAGAVAALRSGGIDAISNVEPVTTMLQRNGDIKIIADTRTEKGTEDVFGGPMPAAALYASEEFLKKNPNTAQALANAIVRALKWIHKADAAEVLNAVPESYLLGDRTLYLAAYNNTKDALSKDGMIPRQGVETAFRVVSSFNAALPLAKVSIDDTYTNEFAIKANRKYK